MNDLLKKITQKGRAMYLAYDQGLEHGPTDFNDDNVNPLYILDIALKGKYNAIVFQKGIAEKYNNEIKKSKVPLIVKLNGKTSLYKGEPYSRQLCTVSEAKKLGAVAVGYTIYIGSEKESKMMSEFEKIEREAHKMGLPVIVWIYPRGAGIEGKDKSELMAYAARVGLEIGADIVKLHPYGDLNKMKWAVKSAGRTKVIFAGGEKMDDNKFVGYVKNVMNSGAMGIAVGRNVWQSEKPIELSEKIRGIIWK